MATQNVSEVVSNLPPELIGQIGLLSKIIGALGGILFLYLVFNIINFFINRKKSKQIEDILSEVRKLNKRLASRR